MSIHESANDEHNGDGEVEVEAGEQEERSYSGRFPVRLPRYLHRQLAEIAREQGVSLSQFVCTAAAKAAGEATGRTDIGLPPSGYNRVSEEEYRRIWRNNFA
jgi:hypothetical protein